MNIGVLGCAGRMGRAVMAEVLVSEDCRLVGGIEADGHSALGEDLGRLAGGDPIGLEASVDAAELIGTADAVIEFSTPEATVEHAALAAEQGKPHVIGTTGLSEREASRLRHAAERIPIVWAANMSLGINLLLGLAEQAARALGAEAFDAEVVEMHHRHKADAPSGTALALGEALARGRGVSLEQMAVRTRDGLIGPRASGTIGFATVRGGDVVGDHTVVFAGAGERLELTHRASDRQIYARGAVHAARWLAGRPPGLYRMSDVLGLAPQERASG